MCFVCAHRDSRRVPTFAAGSCAADRDRTASGSIRGGTARPRSRSVRCRTSHDFVDAAVFVLRPRGHLEAVRQRLALDDQRVIAGGFERHRQARRIRRHSRDGSSTFCRASPGARARRRRRRRRRCTGVRGRFRAAESVRRTCARRPSRCRLRSGVHGPGEMTMNSGSSRSISASVISSLRCTTTSAPSSRQVLDDVVGERIVVIDHQQHVESHPLRRKRIWNLRRTVVARRGRRRSKMGC